MVKKHPFPDPGAGVDFNAGEKTGTVRNKAAQPLQPVVPAPVGAPVQHQGVQTGVAGEHLPGRARRRVAVKNALNIGT